MANNKSNQDNQDTQENKHSIPLVSIPISEMDIEMLKDIKSGSMQNILWTFTDSNGHLINVEFVCEE